jgi:1-acyl-sn-glycerol-3-phosphate acyltransferase
VALAVPHTSNWDGALLVAIAQSIELPIAWMIKESWMRGPVGAALRHFGAIAIDRSKANNVVDAMVDAFRRSDALALVIPPEGTRARTHYWKSGFYHTARGADVPVIPTYLDYGRKVGGFGPPIRLTGDVRADMDRIRAFYDRGGYTARFPANVGPIRLREEDQLATRSARS